MARLPFINSDETVQLQVGMTKSEVLDKIGNPLFVKSGVNNTIIWIYEVRTIEVLSDIDLKVMEIRYNIATRGKILQTQSGPRKRNLQS